MLKQDFCSVLARMESFEKLPEFYQRPDEGVGVDCLPSRRRVHNNHFFRVPEDSDHDLARWRRLLK